VEQRAEIFKNIHKRWFLYGLSFVLFSLFPVFSQAPLPEIKSYVTDQTGTLSSEEKAALESSLREFEKTKGSQIIVVIVPTTSPEPIEQYSIRLADAVKAGRKGIDDGAILLVAKDDRQVRIEVGYGLEGALTDFASKRIIDEQIVPRFKQENYFEGIEAGIKSMMDVIRGEPLPPPSRRTEGNGSHAAELLPILFFVGMFLRSIFGRILGGLFTGGLVFILTWIFMESLFLGILFAILAFLFILIFSSLFMSRGVFYGPGSRGGFGGGSGGGFSGGGGRFGGGGASGRW